MKVRFINLTLLFAAIFCFSAFSAFAQESQAVVVDEVVAQVNDSVITLSGLKKEMQNAVDLMVKQGKKPEEAKAEVEKNKGELIASLIDEELVMQKGKDLGLDADVEAQVNQRFVSITKQEKLPTVEALFKAMNEQGVKPEDFRELWRKEITKQMVIQREVGSKYYFSRSQKDIKDYYEAHKDKFTKPETVTLSELFLGFAGKKEEDVQAKADQLIAQARNGANFTKLVTENSDRPDAAQNKGKIDTIAVKDLNPQVAEAIKTTKVGDLAKFKTDEGVEIIRVDERSAASNAAVFNEDDVRKAMTEEAYPTEQKKFLANLRKDAYIKVAEPYNALVDPILKQNAATAAATKKTDK